MNDSRCLFWRWLRILSAVLICAKILTWSEWICFCFAMMQAAVYQRALRSACHSGGRGSGCFSVSFGLELLMPH